MSGRGFAEKVSLKDVWCFPERDVAGLSKAGSGRELAYLEHLLL